MNTLADSKLYFGLDQIIKDSITSTNFILKFIDDPDENLLCDIF
jgi:hypothetical protein